MHWPFRKGNWNGPVWVGRGSQVRETLETQEPDPNRSRLPNPRNRNSVASPRRLTAGLTTESDPSRTHKNKNFGTSIRWSQYHGRLAVNSLSQIQALTYIRARKVKPIIIIIALAPHYSTTTIFGESSLCNHINNLKRSVLREE